MEKVIERPKGLKAIFGFLFLMIVFCILGYLIISADISKIQDFSIVIVGMIIQAFPFLLIGTIVSSLIGVFVSEELIVKLFPKKGVLATLSAIGIGVFLPLCDCAVIPVAAGLRKKDVPVHAVVTFMMAAPIVNPVVILSTIYAFPGTNIAIYRITAGIIIAILTGEFLRLIYSNGSKNEILKIEQQKYHNHALGCGCESNVQEMHLTCGCNSHECETHGHLNKSVSAVRKKVLNALIHAGEEFFQVSKLFIIGTFITSAIQTFIPKSTITTLAGGAFSAIFIMMVIAFIMSICSTSDSFIGRSFISTVPMSGILGFVVFGPVLDLKNAIMMTGYFKKKFVIEFTVVAFAIAFIVVSIMSIILFM